MLASVPGRRFPGNDRHLAFGARKGSVGNLSPLMLFTQYPALLDDVSWLGGPTFAPPTVALQGCLLPAIVRGGGASNQAMAGRFGCQWEPSAPKRWLLPDQGLLPTLFRVLSFLESTPRRTGRSWTGPLFCPEEEGCMPQFQLNCRMKHIKRGKSPELRKAMKHMGYGYHLEDFALISLHFML